MLTAEQKAAVRREFQKILDAAVPAYQLGQMGLWPEADEEYIQREVERLLYVPKLPSAGDQERKWVGLLEEMARPEFWKLRASAAGFDGPEKSVAWLCARANRLATALNNLLPPTKWDRRGRVNPGQYYFWHPVTPKTDKTAFAYAAQLRTAAREAQEWDVKWFADLLTGGDERPGGMPEGISDFKMEVLCGLRRWNGEVVRMVRLKNFSGEETGELVLEAECFKSPEHFRSWCLKQHNMSWAGNQKHVQDLQWDTNRINAWRIMQEIDCMGWTPLKRRLPDGRETGDAEQPGVLYGIWTYGDAAYCDGKLLEPDRDGIYMVGDTGYYVAERGRESEFALGKPKLYPKLKLGDLLTRDEVATWAHPPAPKPVAERVKESGKQAERAGTLFSEMELLRAYFQELAQRFYDTAGGFEAHLALGAIFAYAAGPEIFAGYGLFPGLWVHGQMESGKTKFTEWLLALCGFDRPEGGLSAVKSTTVGILQESQNYSNVPLWIDEMRPEVGKDKEGIFRDAYNRQSPVKWTPDGVQRKIKTAFVISGESTSSDAATRSRYPHVQISAARRLHNHLEWFARHKKNLFVFWRLVMERRAEFVLLVFKYLKLFLAQKMATGEREKMVHGVDWAAWRAICELLGVEPEVTVADGKKLKTLALSDFDDFALEHMGRAAVDVSADTNISVFWTEFVNAFNADAIPVELFRVEHRPDEYPTGQICDNFILYFEPEGVINALAVHLRKSGAIVPLRRNDLRDQFSKNDYWIAGNHRKRFGSGMTGGIVAWAIDLAKHPLGRQEVSAADFARSLRAARLGDAAAYHHFVDGDPRRGPLFTIVDAVLKREKRQEEG